MVRGIPLTSQLEDLW